MRQSCSNPIICQRFGDLMDCCCLLLRTQGEFQTRKQLSIHANYSKVTLIGLKTTAMIQHYNKLYRLSEEGRLDFGLSRQSHLCSTVVLDSLEKGGLKKLIPAYGRFGHPYHLFLLALRPSIAIAAISPLYFSLISLHGKKKSLDWLCVSSFFSVTLILVLFMEKAVNTGILPGLSEHSHRKRSLIEICSADIAVQAITLWGIGLGGLAFREVLTKDPEESHFTQKIGLDYLFWLSSITAGFLTLGTLSSKIAYTLAGLSTIDRPNGIHKLALYLENTKLLDPAIRHYQFLKEASLGVFFIVTSGLNYIARRYYVEPYESFLIGCPASIISGYCTTKLILHFLNKEQHKLIANISTSNQPDSKLQKLLETHDPKPEQFALIALSTSAGIIASIFLLQTYVTTDTLSNCLVGIPGSMVGFLVGAYIYEMSVRLTNNCAQSTSINNFWRSRYSLLHDQSNDIESEVTQNNTLAN